MIFTNRVAIITGSASHRGIGRATALRLVESGVAVIINDINIENLNLLAQEIIQKGGKAITVLGDSSLTETALKLAKVAEDQFGKCDILVNNAGITESLYIEDTTEEKWDRMIRVNLKSVFLCTKALLPIMKKNNYGRIVNLSSSSGRSGSSFGSAHYAATKAGIIGFTRSIAREVASYGITVNAIAPGSVDTDILKGVPSKDGRSEEQIREDRINKTPLKRLASADEIASTIAFLASDEASFVTGAVLDVNGGSFMG